jgi:hypothetical protein
MFRDQLKEVISHLRKANLPGGVSLDFAQEVKEARSLSKEVKREAEQEGPQKERLVPKLPLTEANARLIQLGLQPSPSGLDMNYYKDKAAHDPNIALAGLRLEIEAIARNLAKGFKVSIDANEPPAILLRRLLEAGAITRNQFELAISILRLCDAAVHGQTVYRTDAEQVINVAEVLKEQYLRWLSWGFSDGWKPSDKKA